MDGQHILVKDIENDVFDQICEVKIIKNYVTTGSKKKLKMEEYVNGIQLINEEYLFEYNWKGECENGEFRCYSANL